MGSSEVEGQLKKKINVGMIGLGTVGSGAFRILCDNAELIRHRVGVPIEIVKVAVRDTVRDRGLDIPRSLLTDNPSHVVDDPNVDILSNSSAGMSLRRDCSCVQSPMVNMWSRRTKPCSLF